MDESIESCKDLVSCRNNMFFLNPDADAEAVSRGVHPCHHQPVHGYH
jgi:hypothetical protein